jgi:hypothetical protein
MIAKEEQIMNKLDSERTTKLEQSQDQSIFVELDKFWSCIIDL